MMLMLPVMSGLFSGRGDQAAIQGDYRNLKNGLIYETNKQGCAGREGVDERMNFSRPDAAGAGQLNRVLWRTRRAQSRCLRRATPFFPLARD